MKQLLLLLTMFISLLAYSQEKTKYIINTRTGKFDAINSLTGTGIVMKDIPIDTVITYVLTLRGDSVYKAETTTGSNASDTSILTNNVSIPAVMDTMYLYNITSSGKYLFTFSAYPEVYQATYASATGAYFSVYHNDDLLRQTGVYIPIMTTDSFWLPSITYTYVLTLTANDNIYLTASGTQPSVGTLRTQVNFTITKL